MNIPTWALEAAIRGGWSTYGGIDTQDFKEIAETPAAQALIILDPEFWKCLGKELGWTDYSTIPVDAWKHNHFHRHAFDLFHLILTSQPTEPFWEPLKPKDV